MILNHFMPDFLGIGGHRCGSTWLHRNLRKSDEIWMPKTKELHFFDRHLPTKYRPVSLWYVEVRLRYAKNFTRGRMLGKIVGEITPAYGVSSPEEIAFIKKMISNARILFGMRDPVERSWSQARRRFPKDGEDLRKASVDQVISFFKRPGVIQRSDYLTILKNWTSYYDMEKIFTYFFDRVIEDPAGLLSEIFRFLGCRDTDGAEIPGLRKIVNPSQELEIPEIVEGYLRDTFYKQNQQLEAFLGKRLPWNT